MTCFGHSKTLYEIYACINKCTRANESDNLFLFDSAVHVMSAAMTNKKAAMVSTQAASTVESCRVATAVGLAGLNARFLGGRDRRREQRHGSPTMRFPVVVSELITLPSVRIENERAFRAHCYAMQEEWASTSTQLRQMTKIHTTRRRQRLHCITLHCVAVGAMYDDDPRNDKL